MLFMSKEVSHRLIKRKEADLRPIEQTLINIRWMRQ
jgi:hypothetical protein